MNDANNQDDAGNQIKSQGYLSIGGGGGGDADAAKYLLKLVLLENIFLDLDLHIS